MELSLKQKLFVEKYLETRNAFASAREAGYSGDDATLRSIGSENLTKPNIRQELDNRLRPHILSANQVLAELSAVAFAPWNEFLEHIYDKDGKVVDVKLKLNEKLKALELVGKYHKLFTDKIDITGDIDAAVEHELARVAAGSQADITSEAESETIN